MSLLSRKARLAALAVCTASIFLEQAFASPSPDATLLDGLQNALLAPSPGVQPNALLAASPAVAVQKPANINSQTVVVPVGDQQDDPKTQKAAIDQKIQDEKAESALKTLWGKAAWPKTGEALRPTADQEQLRATSTFETAVSGLIALTSIAGIGVIAFYTKSNGDGSMELGADAEPLLGARRASQPGSMFFMHLRALGTATCWRHMHPRAFWMHFLRVAMPGAFLFLMHKLRAYLASGLESSDAKAAVRLSGATSADVSNGVLDYVFTVTVLYMVMMSMVFFVRQVSQESESGLRHLLHVSGLSRWAYLLATIGVDGLAVTMVGLLFMVELADCLLQLRIVLWSSPLLLLLMLNMMVMSALASGYLLHLISPSARVASMAAQLLVGMFMLSVPFAVMSPDVPKLGDQSWLTIAFPTIAAYRGLFELVAGCVKGRCLVMSDLTDAMWDRKANPWEMIIGSSQNESINDVLTPPAALLSFVAFALLTSTLTWVLVIVLDMRCYPSLSSASAEVSGTAVLKVQDLVHGYGWLQGSSPVQVLNGVSFAVSPGEVLGMLGPNGAGKTTCIRCIVGEESPSSGSVAVNSTLSACGSYIGFCPQETVVITDLTVAENLLFFAYVRGANGIEAAHFLESMLSASRLTEKRNWMPDTLSGGMRRRLAVTCALIGAPAVAILDEPTTGLDPISRRGIWNTITENKLTGSCCLLTTHMLEEAEALCSNLIVLRKGEIAAKGSVQELKEQWGTGYFLSVDCKPSDQELAMTFVASVLPDCLPDTDRAPIKSNGNGQMTFKLNVAEEALGHLIINIAQGKEKGGILRWGLSQASLEDTYLQIIDAEPQEAEATVAPEQPVDTV